LFSGTSSGLELSPTTLVIPIAAIARKASPLKSPDILFNQIFEIRNILDKDTDGVTIAVAE
jgi:hypothetical protein